MMRFDQCKDSSASFAYCFISYNEDEDKTYYKYPNKNTENTWGCFVARDYIAYKNIYNLIWSKK